MNYKLHIYYTERLTSVCTAVTTPSPVCPGAPRRPNQKHFSPPAARSVLPPFTYKQANFFPSAEDVVIVGLNGGRKYLPLPVTADINLFILTTVESTRLSMT
ncbi:hypothetical protein J6590_030560 [Homalodisca vitripennis]|nr:hypothetical protein J6590_030560 [Homalodisca vitripennis]